MHLNWVRISFITLILIGCSSGTSETKEDQQKMEQAANIHNQLVSMAEQLHELLVIQKSDPESIQDSVLVLQRELQEWESNLIEVPGNEAHHKHNGDHSHHHHDSEIQLTPEEILNIQKESENQLNHIKRRIENLNRRTK